MDRIDNLKLAIYESGLSEEDQEALLEYIEESVALVALESTLVTLFGAGSIVALTAVTWRILDAPRRACKIYEQNNPDVIPFKKLKKIAYKTKPYEDEIDEPETGLNQKLNIFLPQAVYAMLDENENVIYQAYFDTTASYNTQIREAKFSLNSSLAKKHSKYYISSFLLWKGMLTRDLYNWANKILKEDKSEKKDKKKR